MKITHDLIQRSLSGEQEAFTALFDRYKNLVYRTAFLMLGDPDEADDALQEVFIRVYRFLHTYQPSKGAFTTWLHQITTNYCLNQRRWRIFGHISFSWVKSGTFLSREPDVEEKAAAQIDLLRALQSLKPAVRAVIVLRYYNDLPYSEIAQILGLPLGTVQSRLNRGIKKMRALLNDVAVTENLNAAVEEVQK